MRILVIGDFHGIFPEKLKKKISKEEFDLIIAVGDYFGIKDWRAFLFDMFKRIKNKKEMITREEFFGIKKLKKIMKKDEIAGKKVMREINKIGKKTRVIYIFGNTDDDWYNYPFEALDKVSKVRKKFLAGLKNMKEINYGKKVHREISIVGFGGYMDPKVNYEEARGEKKKRMRKRLEKTEKKLFSLMNNLKKERIFVFHYPPLGVFDIIKEKKNPYHGKSAGVKMFRQVIKKYKPELVLCGHMHEYQGVKKIGDSLIVNPGEGSKGKAAIIEYIKGEKKKIKVKFIK